jgi:cobalt-zinc-cadmium efflux system outer membrane protein
MRKGLGRAEFEAAKLRVTGEVLDLVGEVQEAFYDAQAAEQLLEMRRAVTDATAASLDLARRLRLAGNNRDLDVLNERALHERARLDLADAETQVVQTRERLTELMGLWGDETGWRLAQRLPELPAEDGTPEATEARAVERSIDLAILRADVEVAARSLGIARPFGGLNEAELGVAAERETDGQWSVGPSVSVPLPIFGQGGPRVAAARARLQQAGSRYYAAAVRVRSRARAAEASVLAARDRAAYSMHVMLPLQERIVAETQLQYNAMQVGAFQLLSAKRDQIEAGADYVNALRDYWQARSGLDLILAGRLPKSISARHERPVRASAGRQGEHE